MLERGLGIIPTDSPEGSNVFKNLCQGSVQLFSQSNPAQLFSAINGGLNLLGNKLIKKNNGEMFKIVYFIDFLKRWYLFRMMDLKRESQENEVKEFKEKNELVPTPLYINQLAEHITLVSGDNDKKDEKYIKHKLRKFERDVFCLVKNWEIGYHWLKNLCEMCLFDVALIWDDKLTEIKENLKITRKFTMQDLESMQWVHRLSKDTFLVNSNNLYGKLTNFQIKDNDRIKQALKSLSNSSDSLEMKKYLFFGDGDKFHGLCTFIDFGCQYENSLASKLTAFGSSVLSGIHSGKSLPEAIFSNITPVKILEKHIQIIFDRLLITLKEKLVEEVAYLKDTLFVNPIRAL